MSGIKPALFALITIIISETTLQASAQSIAPYILSGYICEVLYSGGTIRQAVEVGMPQAIIDRSAPRSMFKRGMNDTIRNAKALCPELWSQINPETDF